MLRSVVTRHWDEGSGAEYFYWSNDGHATWTKPALLGSEELPWYGAEEAAEGAASAQDAAAGHADAAYTHESKDDHADALVWGDDGEDISADATRSALERFLDERRLVNPKAGEILCIPARADDQHLASLALFGQPGRLVQVCVKQVDTPYRSVVRFDEPCGDEAQDVRLFAFDRAIGATTEVTIFTEDDPERYGLLTEYARVEPVRDYLEWAVVGGFFASYAPRPQMTRFNVVYAHSPYRSLVTKEPSASAIWKTHFSFYAYEADRFSVRVSPDGAFYGVGLGSSLDDWRLCFYFVAFTQQVPGSTRVNVMERHDPVRRFKVSLGKIAVRDGWTLMFSFYVLEVPLPGTVKLSLQQCHEPEGYDQCRISRHMPLPPWRHSAYLYAYDA